MNAHLFCANVLAFSLQMALLIAAGALAASLFRLTDPRPRLLFLQALLVLSLVLPFAWIREPAPAAPVGNVSIRSTVVAVHGAAPSLSFSVTDAIATLLMAGVLIRLGWLALGVLRLHSLRRRAMPAELPWAIIALEQDLGVSCEFYVSGDISGPVTFGLRRPTVLVPPKFLDAGIAEQQAMACHELLHLGRRDWLFTLAEEVVRALFWFHPAIWWLLARIQLAREEVVDHAAIAHTRDREAYLSALLSTAAGMIEADVAPAPLFLARRHLARRVSSIQKGASMSVRRIVSSLAGMVPLLGVAVAIGWQSFPLTAAPQAEPVDSPGVEITQSYKLLHRTGIEYPHGALAAGTQGDVVASVTVDDRGAVADAKIVSGPPELRSVVLRSVLEWHFDPTQDFPADRTFEVAVRFTPPPGGVPAQQVNGNMAITIGAPDLSQAPAALRDQLSAALKPWEGQQIALRQLPDIEAAIRNVDSDLRSNASFDKDGKLVLAPRLSTEPAASSAVPETLAPSGGMRIRVGGNVQATNLVQRVLPVYPPDAKQARIQGKVRFNAVIGTDGHVKELQLVSGHPMLVDAARDAVAQWLYRPTLLNGNPVEVATMIDINFTLAP